MRARGVDEPEDLTGEVFVQLVRDLPRFEGDAEAFRAWVFTIAYHRLLDARRYSRRRPVEPAPHEALESRGGRGGDAETEALEHLATERVREALDQLAPGQRDVLLLRIVGDLTVDQVARVIGKRPGAVKALQRRGLVALRREISRQGVPL